MKLSWSHKFFLKINTQVGKRPWLDCIMIFAARWLVFIMGAMILSRLWVVYMDIVVVAAVVRMFAFAIGGTLLINWILGLFWKHPRPIVQFPEIRQLCIPYQTFKSFPSDHATISWMMAFLSVFYWVLLDRTIILTAFLFIAALAVSIARIYVGVHYPRDIIGGFIMAIAGSFVSYLL